MKELNFSVWQLPTSNPQKFKQYSLETKICMDDYVRVYADTMLVPDEVDDSMALEILFTALQNPTTRFPNFCGHSLSVSDVICITDSENKYYYVDRIGFVRVKNFEHETEIKNAEDITKAAIIMAINQAANEKGYDKLLLSSDGKIITPEGKTLKEYLENFFYNVL